MIRGGQAPQTMPPTLSTLRPAAPSKDTSLHRACQEGDTAGLEAALAALAPAETVEALTAVDTAAGWTPLHVRPQSLCPKTLSLADRTCSLPARSTRQ